MLEENDENGDGLIFVVVDGQNFRYSVPGWKKMNINYFNLGKVLYGKNFSRAILEKMRVVYIDFFQIDGSKMEFQSVEEKNQFLDTLSNNGVAVKTCDTSNLRKRNNGRLDFNMDRHVREVLEELTGDSKVSHIILMSGDGDFAQLLQRAQKNKKRVTVVSRENSLSPRIKKLSDVEVIYFEDVVEQMRC